MLIATILKYVGAAVATLLGTLALVTSFREENSRPVTFGGRVLLLGIVLSGLVVIGTQVVEDFQRDRERRELLEHVTRGQYLIREAQLTCLIDFETENQYMTAFRERFTTAAMTAKAAIAGGQRRVPGISWWTSMSGRPVDSITVCSDSHLFPNMQTDPVAYAALHRVDVTLHIYRNPIHPTAYPFHGALNAARFPNLKKPDLIMSFSNDHATGERLCLDYDFEKRHLMLKGFDLSTDPRSWNGTGQVISLLDLRGAQMFIEIPPAVTVVGTERVRISRSALYLRLRVGEFEGFGIRADELKRHVGVDGLPFFEYRFPTTLEPILHSQDSISIVTTSRDPNQH
jgi:hypothetical protein